MPKYDLFKPLHLLSFVESLHIKYKPGIHGSETCRNLYLMATSDYVINTFPKLKFTYEIASYDCKPEIIVTVAPNKTHKFGIGTTINDIQKQIDEDQYRAYLDFMKRQNIEYGLNEDE